MKLKRIFAALLAGAALLALVGCGTSGSTGKPASSAASTPKDYTQILHDARSAEDNEYYMIFTKGADGKYTAQYGYSKDYEADQLNDEIANMMMPMLNLEDGMAEDFAASLSTMMVQSYGLAMRQACRGQNAGRGRRPECLCGERAAVHGALSRGPVSDRQERESGDSSLRRGGPCLL